MANRKFKQGDIVYIIRKNYGETDGGWAEWNGIPLEIKQVDPDKNFPWPYSLTHPDPEVGSGIFAERELALAKGR